ncbi:MAG: bcp [Rickettsiaceae bacterium]|jgi:peroxiredoxin Q/BCP|nr:bcp [Rickettsiaceae bacterium]
MIKEGMDAPNFNLPLTDSKHFELASLKGKKNVVIYFYPKDDTPGCTLEAKDFALNLDKFKQLNTEVIGISKDNLNSHSKFKAKYCLPFDLASDETGEVCNLYGVWVEKSMYGKKYMGIERSTIFIDSQGKIAKIWPKVKVDGHVNEVLEAIKTLN